MNKNISIIGVSLDLGASCRGAKEGPAAIRLAGIVERLENNGFKVKETEDIRGVSADQLTDIDNHKHMDQVLEVNARLADVVSKEMALGRFPLTLGGDHSVALGSIAGVTQQVRNLGVIWFDAHTDINTGETSPSGNIHGMPLAASLGIGHDRLVNLAGFAPKIKPEHIVIMGAREIDPGERELIRRLNIKVFTMHEIDKLGMGRVMDEALEHVKKGTDGVHLSLDLDGLDPEVAPGVGTPVRGGISYREGRLAMEMLADANVLVSADLVEVNPSLDRENMTARVAVELITSALGEKLL